MEKFNLNIDQYFEELKLAGDGELRAISCIQYPVYCIHAKIIDTTPEELDKLDKAILGLLKSSLMETISIANILGLSKRLVENRMEKMAGESFISADRRSLTEDGIDFLENGSEKRYRKKEIDVYLDGATLNPLNKEFSRQNKTYLISENDYFTKTYQNGDTQIQKDFAPDLVHSPINLDKLKNLVSEVPEKEREKLGIPNGLDEIVSFSFTLLSLPILISLSDRGLPQKQVTNGYSHLGDPKSIIQIKESLETQLHGLMIQLKVDSKFDENHNTNTNFPNVFNNWFEIDKNDFGQNRIFSFSKDDFIILLRQHYGIKTVDTDNIYCKENELVVNVTKEMLLSLDSNESNQLTKQSFSKKKLIENVLRKRDYIPYNPTFGIWILFISFDSNDEYVLSIKQVLETYQDSDKKTVVDELLKIENSITVPMRDILKTLELYHVQEEIDINKYMFNPKN